jgi:heme/copper-type cytochrome/quinol oxidase subunit 3
MITGGLSRATPEELADPGSITRVKTGQKMRIIGQCLFFAAIFAAYIMLGIIIRKAQRFNKPKEALWWIAATAPFLILRGIYGIVSASDWQFSYYLPTNVRLGHHNILRRE